MYIRDVMRAPVVTIAADVPLDQASAVMQGECIKHLPVLYEGTVIGLLTARACRRAMQRVTLSYLQDVNCQGGECLRVRDVMSQGLVTLAPDTPAREAARLVWEGQTGCILVLHAGKLVGIVTTTDLLDAFVVFLDKQGPLSYRHLLVPMDLRAVSLPAVRKAVALAYQHRADITLLYVLPRLSTMITADIDHISPEIVVQIVEDCRAEALRHLAELVPPGAASLITCQAIDGEPATEIVRTAIRIEADLIIVGRRRRRGLKRLLARCVAREVIRRAPCPVLVVEEATRYELV